MNRDHTRKNRRPVRLTGFDYTSPAAYFVTLCTHRKERYFGSAGGGSMNLTEAGRIADECWHEIPTHFPGVLVDSFVIMPNHLHGVLFFMNASEGKAGTGCILSLQELARQRENSDRLDDCFQRLSPGSLSVVIGVFKAAVSRRTRARKLPFWWQPRYYDRIVRSDRELERIRRYIADNPRNWHLDMENKDAELAEVSVDEYFRDVFDD